MILTTIYKMFRVATGKEISDRELVTIRIADYIETTAIAAAMFSLFVKIVEKM